MTAHTNRANGDSDAAPSVSAGWTPRAFRAPLDQLAEDRTTPAICRGSHAHHEAQDPADDRSSTARLLASRPVHLIALGGTIACTKLNGENAPTLSGKELLRLADLHWSDVHASDPMRLDSAEMTSKKVAELAGIVRRVVRRQPTAGICVSMGTDTLIETACTLQRLLSDVAPTTPIVITGSMRTSEETDWDGKANLRAAVTMARHGPPSVSIAFGSRILEPSLTVKLSPIDPHGIVSVVDTGQLGHCALDQQIAFTRHVHHMRTDRALFNLQTDAVVRFTLHQGATASQLEGLLSARPQACVLEAFGDANFPVSGRRGAAFLQTIQEEIAARGTLFVVVSQCPFGTTDCAYPGGRLLQETGVLPAGRFAGFAAAAARLAVVTAMEEAHAGRCNLWQSVLPGDVDVNETPMPLIIGGAVGAYTSVAL